MYTKVYSFVKTFDFELLKFVVTSSVER